MNPKRAANREENIPENTKHHHLNAPASRTVVVSLVSGVIVFVALLFAFSSVPNPKEAEQSERAPRNVQVVPSSFPTPNTAQPLSVSTILRETVLESSSEHEPEEEQQSLTAQFYERFNVHPDDSSLQLGYFEHEDALDVFIEQHISELDLPEFTERDIALSPHSGKEAVITYIANMSAENNKDLYSVEMLDIDRAFSSLAAAQNPTRLIEVIAQLNHNVDTLKTIPVPEEAVSLHALYVSAYMILAEHTAGLLHYQNDPVSALASASIIAELESVFEEIEVQLAELLKDITQYPI